MQKIIVATANAGKVKEFTHHLQDQYTTILSLADIGWTQDIIEDGLTFEKNALIKARTIFKATQQEVLSDDSGLEVLALNNAPGIYTARYAGVGATDAQNRALMLKNLENQSERSAQFVCCLAWIQADGTEMLFRGEIKGRIHHECVGENGFGYDPIFIPNDENPDALTYAQMTLSQKKANSHRGRALEKMHQFILSEQGKK
jgi:non-canonical purine NTP pyrophosphatase (RdgB/HAM1 family)